MSIVMKHIQDFGLEIGIIQNEYTSYGDIQKWRQISECIIRLIYMNQLVYIVTKEPQKWSLCHEIGVQHDITIQKKRYIASPVFTCSPQFIASILEDDEFERDLLWVVSADPQPSTEDISELITLYSKNYHQDLQTNREIVREMDDGKILQWYAPKDKVDKKACEIREAVSTALST